MRMEALMLLIALSIHDLTRRSTTPSLWYLNVCGLSIHDLTRRSTVQLIYSGNQKHLSIHDLTRRSTFAQMQEYNQGVLSIHDLTRRSTFTDMFAPPSYHAFNSRPHKEVDHFLLCSLRLQLSFNSRPHKEVDPSLTGRQSMHSIFQFTTSQGGRRKQYRHSPAPFNSRPHKEVDRTITMAYPIL